MRNAGIPQAWLVWGEPERITCFRCARTSFSHGDVSSLYCGGCQVFHEQRREHELAAFRAFDPWPGLSERARPVVRAALGLDPKVYARPTWRQRIRCSLGRHDSRTAFAIVPTRDYLVEAGFAHLADGPRYWSGWGFPMVRFHRDAPSSHLLTGFFDCAVCGHLSPPKGVPEVDDRLRPGVA